MGTVDPAAETGWSVIVLGPVRFVVANMPCLALACGLAEAQTDQTKGISLNSTTGRTFPAESPQGQSPPSMQAAPEAQARPS